MTSIYQFSNSEKKWNFSLFLQIYSSLNIKPQESDSKHIFIREPVSSFRSVFTYAISNEIFSYKNSYTK